LTSFIVGPASGINIDWEVIPTTGTAFAPGLYAYLYQIENTSKAGVDAFSVTLAPAGFASVVGAGILAGDNLDLLSLFHPPHDVAFFPILAGEADPFPLAPVVGGSTTLNPLDDTVSWTFSPIASGTQSDTLYFLSTLPPVYGNAVAQDSIPPSPWGTLAVGAQPVPVPLPEPATWVLAGAGLLAIGLFRWARR
jgi:hypothetical protein